MQLFLLQLKDPLIRQQVALQILILVHFLRYETSFGFVSHPLIFSYFQRSKALPLVKDDQSKANYEKEFLGLHDKSKELLEVRIENCFSLFSTYSWQIS